MLLGDSTIDNFVYVREWEDTVGQQMKQHISQVTDLAVECSKTEHILPGQKAPQQYAQGRQSRGYPPYSTDIELNLEERLKKHNPSHVLLSIIGNDVRAFYHGSITEAQLFKILSNDGNYGKVIKRVKSFSSNMKLMIVMPYRKQDLPYHEANKELAKRLFEIAKKNEVPVIDLSRTFDPFKGIGLDAPHYYNSIEPNKQGAACICKLAKKVIQTHNWSGPSQIYFDPKNDKCNRIIRELNKGEDHEINWKISDRLRNADDGEESPHDFDFLQDDSEAFGHRADANDAPADARNDPADVKNEPADAKNKLSDGEIAGIVVGAVAFVGVVFVIFYCHTCNQPTERGNDDLA